MRGGFSGWMLLGILAVGCSTRPADPSTVRVDDLSVVLVVLDAGGARHFGAYGNPLPTSPAFDALARDGGTLFTRAYAQSAWTLPSVASLLTGRYPPRHRQNRTRVGPETIATVLHDAGIATAAFSENPFVTSAFGFDHGFDVFHEYFPKHVYDEAPRFYPTDSERMTTDAIAWLDADRDRRVFLYLHLLTPHSPYAPPSPFAGRFDPDYAGTVDGVPDTLLRIDDGTLAITPRDLEHVRHLYEENLAYGDHLVGRVVEALRRSGRLDHTILVVTADHGEAFREHGRMLHTTTLYEEMIHVPLLVRLPERFGRRPARCTDVVELRDLMPTLCHVLGRRCAVGTDRSLARRLRARTARPGIARAWTSDAATFAFGAVVTDARKLLLDVKGRRASLFDLARDADERVDLAAAEPARVRRLVRRLREARGGVGVPRTTTTPESTGRRLRALGYVE